MLDMMGRASHTLGILPSPIAVEQIYKVRASLQQRNKFYAFGLRQRHGYGASLELSFQIEKSRRHVNCFRFLPSYPVAPRERSLKRSRASTRWSINAPARGSPLDRLPFKDFSGNLGIIKETPFRAPHTGIPSINLLTNAPRSGLV